MTIKALSILNPWVSPILLGIKDVENRTWRTTQTLPLTIWVHASKGYDRTAPYFIADDYDLRHPPLVPRTPAGTICGYVTIESIHHSRQCGNRCSAWAADGQWHWVLRNAHPTPPVPCRGSLGVWTVPDQIESLLD